MVSRQVVYEACGDLLEGVEGEATGSPVSLPRIKTITLTKNNVITA